MIANKIELANFKSFGPDAVSFPLCPVTALVGENNTGKSNVLLALDLFRNFSKRKVQKRHFHGHDPAQEITIKITFSALAPSEKKLFRRHLGPDDTLTIIQTIKASPTAATGDKNQTAAEDGVEAGDVEVVEEKIALYVRSGIEWLDDSPTAKKEIEKLWKGEMKAGGVDFKEWSGLSKEAPPTKEQLAEKIESFWDEKWNDIPKQEEPTGTKPLGWPSKLTGHLPLVVFIPALKKVSEEAKASKTNPFGSLLNWLMESVAADLRKGIQTKLDTLYEEALSSLPKEKDDETGDEITRLELINRTLSRHLPDGFDAALSVAFQKPEVDDTIFGETRLSADDGFLSEIEDKGLGLQRAALIAIIRSYLKLRPKLEAKSPGLGRVIFAVEEPEIYLHPTIKRSLYGLFRQLGAGGDQVVYSSHDGYFLDVEQFQEIRVFRKQKNHTPPRTGVEQISEQVLLKIWEKLSERKGITLQSVRERLRNVYDPFRNEGFLSKGVLVCEGPTERAAFPLYMNALGYNLDQNGISVIDAGSADLLDYFYILLTELGIPTYVLWDGDKPNVADLSTMAGNAKDDAKRKSDRNKRLAELLDVPLPRDDAGYYFWHDDQVTSFAAVLSRKYEDSAMTILPNSDEVKGEARKLFGSDSKPMLARYYAQQAIQRGEREGDVGKYIPKFLKDVRQLLPSLKESQKLSTKLGILVP
jgi:predicted ATP-dependent endonuclease of OLD family